MKRIFKRVICIYTDYDPIDVDIEDLSREAMSGDAHYVFSDEELEDPYEEEDLIGTDFFHRCLQGEDEDD